VAAPPPPHSIMGDISLKKCGIRLPPLRATPPPHSNLGDISGNYKWMSTNFSVYMLQTMRCVLGEKMF